MPSIKKLRTNAAYLSLAIGVTYLAQLWTLGLAPHVLIGALMGLAYLLLGLGLLGTSTPSLWMGFFLSLLCIAASVHRYFAVIDEPIILANIALNLPVLLICAYLFCHAIKHKKNGT